MKFKLLEKHKQLDESSGGHIRRNIKDRMIVSLGLDPEEGYVLHHIHNEKYIPDDDEIVNDYRDIKNVVLIPKSRANQASANDLHLLVHYLAQHKHEMDEKFCIGIRDGGVVYYSLNDLVEELVKNK